MAATTIPIQSLHPEVAPPADKTIRAIVSLYWPYSSSTKQCALLLADPDFRLRSNRGQVRVRFVGAAATAVAEGRVGIGDELYLSLRAAKWEGSDARVVTPGKSVEAELVYRGALSLRVVKKSGDIGGTNQRIEASEGTPPPEGDDDQPNVTPARSHRVSSLRDSVGAVDLVPIYSSPAFVKRQRLSGHNVFKGELPYDPFADAERELEEEECRPKKKQRISDVRNWRFADRTPSPEKVTRVDRPEQGIQDKQELSEQPQKQVTDLRDDLDRARVTQETSWSQMARRTAQQQDIGTSAHTSHSGLDQSPDGLHARHAPTQSAVPPSMLPPPLAKLQMPDDAFVLPPQSQQHQGEDRPLTPKLQPVPSNNLPLPSPFPFDQQRSIFDTAQHSHPLPSEQETRQSESRESLSDGSGVLEINPTIVALAEQSRQLQAGQPVVTSTGDDDSPNAMFDGFPPSLSQLNTQDRVQHSIDSADAATPDTEPRDDREDVWQEYTSSSGIYAPGHRRHPEYLSDTEEDEELQEIYSQHTQKTALERLQHEGIKQRDFAAEYAQRKQREAAAAASAPAAAPTPMIDDDIHDENMADDEMNEDDVEEVIEDMGEGPEESEEEGRDEEDVYEDEVNEADEEDDELEIQPEETSTTDDHDELHLAAGTGQQSPPVEDILEIVDDDDSGAVETIIEVPQRKSLQGISNNQRAQHDQPPSAEERQTTYALISDQPQSSKDSAPSHSTAQAPQQAVEAPPKTPARYGFGFGFDGAASPPTLKPTPQSGKERLMAKTYGSLFGFRISPSPEKERQPQQKSRDVPALPMFQLQNEAAAETVTPVGEWESGQPGMETSESSSLNKQIEAETQGRVFAASLRPVDLPQPDKALLHDPSRPREPGDHTVHASQIPAALSKSFEQPDVENTADVELAPADAEPSAEQIAQVEHLLKKASEQTVEENLQVQGITLKEEQPTTSRRPQHPSLVTDPGAQAAPPSTAPVLSLGSQKIQAPPPSTAPEPSQVEVVDLGSSDDEEEEAADEAVDESDIDDAAEVLSPAIDNDKDVHSSDGDTEQMSIPETTQLQDSEMEDQAEETLDQAMPDTSSSTAAHWPNPQHESFFADQIQADGVQTLHSPSLKMDTQQSGKSSTQRTNKSISDEYRYFSSQSIASSFAEGKVDEEPAPAPETLNSAATNEERSSRRPKRTAQSEVTEIVSSSHVAPTINISRADRKSHDETMDEAEDLATRADIHVRQSSEARDDAHIGSARSRRSRVQQSSIQRSTPSPVSSAREVSSEAPRRTRAQAQKLTQTTPRSTADDVQVAASSAVKKTPQGRRPVTPEESLHRPDSQPLETQHRGESQPFETQTATPGPAANLVPPTPEVTNDGLKVVVDEPAEQPIAGQEKRSRKRAGSTADKGTTVRRSPRTSHVPSQVSEEAAEAELAVTISRNRTVTLENPHRPSPSASFDSDLLSPDKKTPVRRSLRKSQAPSEVTENIEDSIQVTPPQKATRKKSPRKSKAEAQLEDDMKRAIEEELANAPPKRTSRMSRLQSEQPRPVEKHVAQELDEDTTLVGEDDLPRSTKTPSRKSFTSRLGQVPEAISAWFSPRRSTRQQIDEEEESDEKTGILQRTSSNGLVTTKAYYTPLSSLREKLNPSSQPGADNTVDVLAVVTDSTKPPERAKAGPKDYFTIFRVTDSSFNVDTTLRVEVFRPWHATLPVAHPGDVVLLRSFAVKSRKRQPYLLSNDSSAWLVWKFADAEEGPGALTSSPRSSRRRPGSAGAGAREEVKGPQVELGVGERKRARELRNWWIGERDGEKES